MRHPNNNYTVCSQQESHTQLKTWRAFIEDFLIKRLPKQVDTLLDIGLGDTTFVLHDHYPDFKFDIMDMEPYDKVTHVCNLLEASKTMEENSYDVVVCSEVLEHVKKPWVAAEQLLYMTKPGGFIYITVPSFLFWHPMLPICDDYWRFLPASLPQLFEGHRIIRHDICGNRFQPTGVCCIIQK